MDLLLLEALHGGGVVAHHLGHQHHVGEGDHHVLVEPGVHLFGGEEREEVGDGVAGLGGVALGHSCLEPLGEDGFEVLAPAVCVTAGHDDGGCLLDLALVEGGGAQALLPLVALHHDEAPGLHVVSAGRAEPGLDDPVQVFGRNWRPIEAGGCAPLAYRLAQSLLVLRRLRRHRSFPSWTRHSIGTWPQAQTEHSATPKIAFQALRA